MMAAYNCEKLTEIFKVIHVLVNMRPGEGPWAIYKTQVNVTNDPSTSITATAKDVIRAKSAISVFDQGQGDVKLLVIQPPPGPNGSEALNDEQAWRISVAAEAYALTIGSNFVAKLPNWDLKSILSEA